MVNTAKTTLERLKRLYNRFSVADEYLLLFEMGGIVYAKKYRHLPKRLFYLRERKGKADLYIRFNSQKEKRRLIKSAFVIGSSKDLDSTRYNRGVMAERLVYTFYGLPWKGKDNIPFYKDGDITINGKRVQIKFEHARLAYGSTLRRLEKDALEKTRKEGLKNMAKAWYKEVCNAEIGYKKIENLTDEELDKYEFYIDMVDRWNAEQKQTIEAIRAERRERRRAQSG